MNSVAADVKRLHLKSPAERLEPPYVGCYGLGVQSHRRVTFIRKRRTCADIVGWKEVKNSSFLLRLHRYGSIHLEREGRGDG
jgi:hypothetical protein